MGFNRDFSELSHTPFFKDIENIECCFREN